MTHSVPERSICMLFGTKARKEQTQTHTNNGKVPDSGVRLLCSVQQHMALGALGQRMLNRWSMGHSLCNSGSMGQSRPNMAIVHKVTLKHLQEVKELRSGKAAIQEKLWPSTMGMMLTYWAATRRAAGW